jgi:hypothetical protein
MATKTIKKYQLLKGFQLATGFLVNGKLTPVTFQHGIRKPYLMRGMYSTDDPAMQEAIETDAGFNVDFCLIHSDTGDVIPEEVVPEVPQENIPETTEDLPSDVSLTEETPALETEVVPEQEEEPAAPETENIPVGPVDYPEVTNIQEARQKMFDLFPGVYKPANLPNKKAVLNKAKENNITFSKLA